ncbi:MAG: hypothetical protein ABI665_11040 [Vicinamibacterales bacterium]
MHHVASDAVVILDVFAKNTAATPTGVLDTCRKRLGSSQSHVAKMEAADSSVSLDLMMRSLLSIGATAGEIARLIKKTEVAISTARLQPRRLIITRAAVGCKPR